MVEQSALLQLRRARCIADILIASTYITSMHDIQSGSALFYCHFFSTFSHPTRVHYSPTLHWLPSRGCNIQIKCARHERRRPLSTKGSIGYLASQHCLGLLDPAFIYINWRPKGSICHSDRTCEGGSRSRRGWPGREFIRQNWSCFDWSSLIGLESAQIEAN